MLTSRVCTGARVLSFSLPPIPWSRQGAAAYRRVLPALAVPAAPSHPCNPWPLLQLTTQTAGGVGQVGLLFEAKARAGGARAHTLLHMFCTVWPVQAMCQRHLAGILYR